MIALIKENVFDGFKAIGSIEIFFRNCPKKSLKVTLGQKGDHWIKILSKHLSISSKLLF